GLGLADGTYAGPNARIGDGLYRRKDVDVYQLQATAGQGLTVTVKLPAGGSALYGYLRIFDPDGKQIYGNYWSNWSGSEVVTQDLTLAKDGIYWVGVSAAYNTNYDPNVAGSGSDAFYTGDYSIELKLKTPVPDAAGDILNDALVTDLTGAA